MLNKRPLLELFESHPQFLLRIHYDGTIPGNGFPDRFSGDQEKTERLRFRGTRNGVAVAEEHQVSIGDQPITLHVEVFVVLDVVAEGIALVAEDPFTADGRKRTRYLRAAWDGRMWRPAGGSHRGTRVW